MLERIRICGQAVDKTEVGSPVSALYPEGAQFAVNAEIP